MGAVRPSESGLVMTDLDHATLKQLYELIFQHCLVDVASEVPDEHCQSLSVTAARRPCRPLGRRRPRTG